MFFLFCLFLGFFGTLITARFNDPEYFANDFINTDRVSAREQQDAGAEAGGTTEQVLRRSGRPLLEEH